MTQLITKGADGIRISGRIGKWYVIDATERDGQEYFLLESEKYGDEAAALIVDSRGTEILETYEGFFDEDWKDGVPV
jgi:hypothetical protein